MQKLLNNNYLLFFIIIVAIFFRLYGLNWDQGFHLHPDERAIVMFTTPLQLPKSITEFLSPNSSWNPHFFAYGSFPIYLLKITGNIFSYFDPLFASYDKINLVGRFLSAIFDIGTLIVLFFLAKKLFNKTVALLTTFFYAISVLPIQLSHFYAVDTLLTFFVLVTLYRLIKLYERQTVKNALWVGIFFGLALATKISAIVLIVSIGTALAVDFILIFLKNPHRPHIWFPHLPKFLKRLFVDGVIIIVITFITFIIFEPYALIDFKTFWLHNMQQRQMTYDAFTFPYTLQYVDKIPYWHELKNIFLWGQGPLLATLSFLGALYVTFRLVRPHLRGGVAPAAHLGGEIHENQTIILLTFFLVYFFVVGNFAIGFMRYMLPLYPLLCLFAAVFLYRLLSSRTRFGISLVALVVILLLIWPVMFLYVYTKPNTRVLASDWINKNIPVNSTIAIEHWDDGLPLFGQQNYHILTLPLYEPDTEQKWVNINSQLRQTDYIVIASNRLYTPLQKLTDCEHLPIGRCYTQTANYYEKLFNDSLGFTKVAEFAAHPQFQISNFKFQIRDEEADESFTVYDHPKIMIFQREK